MAKPQPKLSHMPRHIKETIVDDLDTKTKLSLRQTDRVFKEVVGNSRIHYKTLTLSLSNDEVRVYWHKTSREYNVLKFVPRGDCYEEIRTHPDPDIYEEGDYRKAAVAKLLSVFKNPKITVGELVMEVDNSDDQKDRRYREQRLEADRAAVFEEIERILPLINFRPKVEKLNILFEIAEHMLRSVLSFLEPGILKVLHVNNRSRQSWSPRPTIDPRIADMEQWKQLKEVNIDDDSFCLDIPIEKYMHLEKIEFQFSRRPTETAKTILEKLLQKPTMKECILWNSYHNGGFDMTGIQEYLDQLKKIRANSRRNRFKHPYEAGKRVVIDISDLYFHIRSEHNRGRRAKLHSKRRRQKIQK